MMVEVGMLITVLLTLSIASPSQPMLELLGQGDIL